MEGTEVKNNKVELKYVSIERVSNGFIVSVDEGFRHNCASVGKRAVVNSIPELVVYISENFE